MDLDEAGLTDTEIESSEHVPDDRIGDNFDEDTDDDTVPGSPIDLSQFAETCLYVEDSVEVLAAADLVAADVQSWLAAADVVVADLVAAEAAADLVAADADLVAADLAAAVAADIQSWSVAADVVAADLVADLASGGSS
jgi:hypothetical protein